MFWETCPLSTCHASQFWNLSHSFSSFSCVHSCPTRTCLILPLPHFLVTASAAVEPTCLVAHLTEPNEFRVHSHHRDQFSASRAECHILLRGRPPLGEMRSPSGSPLLRCCGLSSDAPPTLNLTVHSDFRMILEIKIPARALVLPTKWRVSLLNMAMFALFGVSRPVRSFALQAAVSGSSSLRPSSSFLPSRCADGASVLHVQRLDDDLRVSLISLLLPSRRDHTDCTIQDLLLLVLIFSRPHDFLADFESLFFILSCSHSSPPW